MYSLCGTDLYAFATQTAFLRVYIRQVVLNCYGLKLALFNAFATTDAGSLAGFHRYGTLVLVHATDKHTATLWTFLAEFDDMARTSLHTGTARGTFILIYLGQSCFRIDADSTELTGRYTVATT